MISIVSWPCAELQSLTVMAIQNTSAERRYKINCYERSGYTTTRPHERRHRLSRESTGRKRQMRQIPKSVPWLHPTFLGMAEPARFESFELRNIYGSTGPQSTLWAAKNAGTSRDERSAAPIIRRNERPRFGSSCKLIERYRSQARCVLPLQKHRDSIPATEAEAGDAAFGVGALHLM